MRDWNHRAKEIAYLLNPAFCGRILYNTIKVYIDESKRPFPFPLIYLILPLILHKRTRQLISSRTQLLIWLQRHPELIIGFAARAKDMVQITNEAIELLLQSGMINLTNAAELEVSHTVRPLSNTQYTNDEIKECISKGEHVAKWFVATGKIETIFVSLGVRP
jgi:hypothetical protein